MQLLQDLGSALRADRLCCRAGSCSTAARRISARLPACRLAKQLLLVAVAVSCKSLIGGRGSWVGCMGSLPTRTALTGAALKAWVVCIAQSCLQLPEGDRWQGV